MSITGERDDQPGGGPQKVGIADHRRADRHVREPSPSSPRSTHRERTGEGQYIDLALLDSHRRVQRQPDRQLLRAPATSPQRIGNAHAEHRALPGVRDRRRPHHPRGRQRQPVRELLPGRGPPGAGRGPALRDQPASACAPRRPDPADRRAMMRAAHQGEWIDALEAADVPCGPINNLKQVFEDPQVRHRGLRVDIPRSAGRRRRVANPMRFSETPVEYAWRRPCSASTPTRCCRKSSARARTRSPHCANAASCERPPHNVATKEPGDKEPAHLPTFWKASRKRSAASSQPMPRLKPPSANSRFSSNSSLRRRPSLKQSGA